MPGRAAAPTSTGESQALDENEEKQTNARPSWTLKLFPSVLVLVFLPKMDPTKRWRRSSSVVVNTNLQSKYRVIRIPLLHSSGRSLEWKAKRTIRYCQTCSVMHFRCDGSMASGLSVHYHFHARPASLPLQRGASRARSKLKKTLAKVGCKISRLSGEGYFIMLTHTLISKQLLFKCMTCHETSCNMDIHASAIVGTHAK